MHGALLNAEDFQRIGLFSHEVAFCYCASGDIDFQREVQSIKRRKTIFLTRWETWGRRVCPSLHVMSAGGRDPNERHSSVTTAPAVTGPSASWISTLKGGTVVGKYNERPVSCNPWRHVLHALCTTYYLVKETELWPNKNQLRTKHGWKLLPRQQREFFSSPML